MEMVRFYKKKVWTKEEEQAGKVGGEGKSGFAVGRAAKSWFLWSDGQPSRSFVFIFGGVL